MSLVDNIATLATRVATEFKSVRTSISTAAISAKLDNAAVTGTLAVAKGGTGSTTVAAARTALAVPYSEEGTYTPTLTITGTTTSTVTHSVQQGIYTKVGNYVFVYFRMVFVPTITSGETNILGATLPVAVSSTYYGGGVATYLSAAFVWPSGSSDIVVRPQMNTSYCRMTANRSAGAPQTFGVDNLTSGSSHEWWGHVWYRMT